MKNHAKLVDLTPFFFPFGEAVPHLADSKWLGHGLSLCDPTGIWAQSSGPRALFGPLHYPASYCVSLSYSHSTRNIVPNPHPTPTPPQHLGQCLGVSLRSSHTYLLNTFSVTGFHALTCSIKVYWTFAMKMKEWRTFHQFALWCPWYTATVGNLSNRIWIKGS